MKTSTMLILGGVAAAIAYAVSKQGEAPEGGDTFEPGTCPPGQEWNEEAGMCVPKLPEGQFDPGPDVGLEGAPNVPDEGVMPPKWSRDDVGG
jgi:hypothetical protein